MVHSGARSSVAAARLLLAVVLLAPAVSRCEPAVSGVAAAPPAAALVTPSRTDPEPYAIEIDAGLGRDAVKLMREEEGKARRASWIWGSVAGISVGYAGWVFIAKGNGESVLTYVSLVGILAGGVGLVQGIMRARETAAIASGLSSAPGVAGTLRVEPRTALAFESDLSSMESEARVSARSALRAGCVVPVLLSGVAIFGLVTGGDAGEQLAGVALGGALAIGGPSMLSYWGSKGRLDRYQSLMTRWNDSVNKGEDKTR